jgi:SAM-dependent methyltransferase
VTTLTPTPALDTYEAFASSYDLFTLDYDYELWIERIVSLSREHGVSGRRALDVACGTGKSTQPLVRRGYEVVGCDLSGAMLDHARRRLGDGVQLHLADLRDLAPDLGEFDLVTCLDDVLNLMYDDGDLIAAFASVRELLADGGVYVFDVNTLRLFGEFFVHDLEHEVRGTRFRWLPERRDARPDAEYRARMDVFEADAATPTTIRHVQRHHSDATVRRCLAQAGLRCLDVLGQSPGVRLSRPADDAVHYKRLYVAGVA